MARRTVLLDTSYILALENMDDAHHGRAKALDRELLNQKAVLLMHWGIVYEIADGYARLARRSKGIELLKRFEQEEDYRVVLIDELLYRDAVDLYRNRPDKEWGLTDCTSFVLMKREGITEALTADVHFRQAGLAALLLDEA